MVYRKDASGRWREHYWGERQRHSVRRMERTNSHKGLKRYMRCLLQGGTGRIEEGQEWIGLFLERVEGFKRILWYALVGDPGQLHLFFLLPTGPVFWYPWSPLHGHQSGLYVCQLGHRPEPYVGALTWPALPPRVPMLTCMYMRESKSLSCVPPAWDMGVAALC